MHKLVKIIRSGFGFGVVPFLIALLGSITLFGLTYISDGSLANAPFTPSTAVAIVLMLAVFGLVLSLAGVAFAASLKLAERIGGKMPEGPVAIVLGTLFAVVMASAVPLLRPTATQISCGSASSILQAVCTTNTTMNTSEQAAMLWSAMTMLLLGYAAVVGLVIGGMVAESHGIKVTEDVKPQMIPAHLTRKPAMTRDQWLRKFKDEDAG